MAGTSFSVKYYHILEWEVVVLSILMHLPFLSRGLHAQYVIKSSKREALASFFLRPAYKRSDSELSVILRQHVLLEVTIFQH